MLFQSSAAFDRAAFAVTSAEVESLGASGLNKWDRKGWEAIEDKAQGLKPAKSIKAPFKMFLGMEAKKEQRAKRKRETVKDKAEIRQTRPWQARASAGSERSDSGALHRSTCMRIRSSFLTTLFTVSCVFSLSLSLSLSFRIASKASRFVPRVVSVPRRRLAWWRQVKRPTRPAADGR